MTRTARIRIENNSYKEFSFRASNWEMTIGPLPKRFPASIEVNYETTQSLAQTYVDVEIYVSKNNGPFALKANDSSTQVRMSASTNYTVQ